MIVSCEAVGRISDPELKAVEVKSLPGEIRTLEGFVFKTPKGILAFDSGDLIRKGRILLVFPPEIPEGLNALKVGIGCFNDGMNVNLMPVGQPISIHVQTVQ